MHGHTPILRGSLGLDKMRGSDRWSSCRGSLDEAFKSFLVSNNPNGAGNITKDSFLDVSPCQGAKADSRAKPSWVRVHFGGRRLRRLSASKVCISAEPSIMEPQTVVGSSAHCSKANSHRRPHPNPRQWRKNPGIQSHLAPTSHWPTSLSASLLCPNPRVPRTNMWPYELGRR